MSGSVENPPPDLAAYIASLDTRTGERPRRGWFAAQADEDDPAVLPGYRWRPYLQIDGAALPIAVSFASEAECEQFIRENVLEKGLLVNGA